jgi:hypothetical protein
MSRKKLAAPQLTDLQKQMIAGLIGQPDEVVKPKPKIRMAMTDPFFSGTVGAAPLTKDDVQAHSKSVEESSPLLKSVLNVLNGGQGDTIERLAFETQPALSNTYGGLWKKKLRLLPDDVLKRIAIQDDLTASIVNTRSSQMAAFGRPQPDRFSTGIVIEPEPGYTEQISSEEKQKLRNEISRAEALLLTCGETRGWSDDHALNFGQFLFMSARNAVVFGRTATEVIYVDTSQGRKPHSFRPIDAGTIYRAAPYKNQAEAVRKEALRMLEDLKNKRLNPERYVADEYTWVQVIEARPVQAFTSEECLVHNFYPTTDVELDGYPITPLDTVITAVTTHINIGTHNKLYFQSGRAAKGMLVIKSDEVDEATVEGVKQQFNASVNSVGNSWRMPVFGVDSEADIVWQPIDSGGRDMEFQYLSDTNARVILSAFQMSPEELPGYSHLSRGTNNQALSESNNEYKLEAHRDVGIRPLIGQFQNFINSRILPLFFPDLAKFCHVKFVGLDADTAEKESVRIQQDMAVHMTMDEVLEKVEKNPVGRRWAGRFLLNPQWQAVLDKYFLQGDIMEYFFGIENASKDPRFQFVNNPMWFQWQQLQMEMQQMQMQQQQMQAQAQQQQQAQQQPQQGGDLTNSVAQLEQTVQKNEALLKSKAQLEPSKKELLIHQNKVVESALKQMESDAKEEMKAMLKQLSTLITK